MLTFANIRSRILRLLDENVNTQAGTTSLVEDALNASHRRLLLSRSWPFLRWPKDQTFTTVAGTRVYALHPAVVKLKYLFDNASRLFLPLISERQWEALGVDRVAEDIEPQGAIYGGWWPVSAQPTAATTLRIVSSSTGDGAGETVILRGLNGSSDIVEETLTAAGTTQVTSTTSFLHVLNVTKTGTWAGTMTLSTSGGTTMLTLLAAEDGKQYPTIEFLETPPTARTYSYTFNRTPRTLSNDTDIPETPFPFSEIHVYDVLLDLTGYNSDTDAKHQRLWKSRYDELWKQLCEHTDEVILGSAPRFVRDIEGSRGRRPVQLSS